jgi:hypothetical protein
VDNFTRRHADSGLFHIGYMQIGDTTGHAVTENSSDMQVTENSSHTQVTEKTEVRHIHPIVLVVPVGSNG